MSDHRAEQTPVRDQGNRRTCVGFAVSAAHEWMAGNGVIRSVEDVLWAGHAVGGPIGDEATSVQLALEGLDRYRHAIEAAWPYGNPCVASRQAVERHETGESTCGTDLAPVGYFFRRTLDNVGK